MSSDENQIQVLFLIQINYKIIYFPYCHTALTNRDDQKVPQRWFVNHGEYGAKVLAGLATIHPSLVPSQYLQKYSVLVRMNGKGTGWVGNSSSFPGTFIVPLKIFSTSQNEWQRYWLSWQQFILLWYLHSTSKNIRYQLE